MAAVLVLNRNASRDLPVPSRVGSDASVNALRCALQAHVRRGGAAAELRPALRLVATEARRGGVRIEHLLVMLKTAWASIPEAWQSPRSGLRDDMLDGLVTLCIEEFYAGARLRAE